jgi:hypothetical protein
MLLDGHRQVTGQAAGCQVAGARRLATLNIAGSTPTAACTVIEADWAGQEGSPQPDAGCGHRAAQGGWLQGGWLTPDGGPMAVLAVGLSFVTG